MLARQLVEAWAGAPEHPSHRQPGRPDKRDEMLRLLRQLGEAALLGQFIADVVTQDYDGSDNAALASCARLLDAKRAGELYAELMRQHFPHWHGHCADLLHDLTFKSKLAADKSGPAALRQIAEAAVSKLDEVGKQEKENEWMSWRVGNKARPVNAALVANLLDVLGKLDASELRVAAAERFAAWPAVFDPVTILVPALGSLNA